MLPLVIPYAAHLSLAVIKREHFLVAGVQRAD